MRIEIIISYIAAESDIIKIVPFVIFILKFDKNIKEDRCIS